MNLKTFAIGLFVATGCATDPMGLPEGENDDTRPTAPRISVMLTDAPGDFEAVWVNITSVEIESAEAGWVTLVEEPQKHDLLTLQNGVTAALGGATLEPGTYGQLRMIVDEASVVVDGVESPLKIASGMETGIKIPLGQTIEENMAYELTLDYDAHKSVKSTGQGYLMTPVIHVKDFVGSPVEEEDGPTQTDAPTGSDEPIL